MTNIVRKYLPEETPKVGDTIRLFEGSFGTCIISKVFEENGNTYYDLDRPYSNLNRGRLNFSSEKVSRIPENKIRELDVYVTGYSGTIENRELF